MLSRRQRWTPPMKTVALVLMMCVCVVLEIQRPDGLMPKFVSALWALWILRGAKRFGF
jgi:uncharacterized membrane-anchored protein